MVGQIVVNDEHVPARFHEMLRDAGRGVGGDVGEPGRVVAFGHDDDGVIHRAVFAQVGDDLGDGGRTLADRAIDAQHILVALVQNGVDRDGGLAGLPVAEDQFALAAADRNERIDDDDAGLQRHGDEGAVHDRPGGALDGQTLAGGDRPFAIEWPAQRVDDAPDQSIAHRHVHHTTRTLDLVARVQMLAFAKEHDADFVRIDVERDAVQIAGKLHQLIKADARKARDLGDAGGDARDRAHLTRRQLRREGFQRPADTRERLVEDAMQAIRRVIQWSAFGAEGTGSGPCLGSRFGPGLASAFGSGLASAFGSGLASAFGSGLASRLGFGLGILVQKFAGALFQRRQIIRDAPGYLVSIGGEFDTADQLRRGLELDMSVRGERFLHRTFDRGPLCRRQIERAMHAHRVVRRLEGGRQLLLGRAGQRTHAVDEDVAHAFLEARGGEVRQRLARDGEDFLLGPADDLLTQVTLFVSQRVLAFGTQRVGILSCFVEQPLTFGFGLVRGFFQERRTLLVEGLVLVLKVVAVLLRFSLLRLGLRELGGDPFLPFVDGVEDGFVKESLQQPHQDEEVDCLGDDGEPVD